MRNLLQNRRNLAESPVFHVAGVPKVPKLSQEVANMSPECRQCVAKGSHVTSGVRGRRHQFPAYSLINGYNKKPFSQNRGRELSSTLL
jgi:hypothetical protein